MLVYVLFCYSSFVVNRVDHFRGGKSPVGGGANLRSPAPASRLLLLTRAFTGDEDANEIWRVVECEEWRQIVCDTPHNHSRSKHPLHLAMFHSENSLSVTFPQHCLFAHSKQTRKL